MRPARSAVIAALGFFALAAQTVLFRDFLTAFESNELGVGAFFGAWLTWVAAGAVFGRQVGRYLPTAACPFELLILLYIPAFLLQQWCIAHARELGGVTVYEVYPFAKMLLTAFWINAPVSLVTGGLFTVACGWCSRVPGLPVAHVYMLETFGSFAGGAVVTTQLALAASTETIFVTAALLLLGAAAVSLATRSREERTPYHLALVIVTLAMTIAFIPLGVVSRWAEMHRRVAWCKLLPPHTYEGCFTTAQSQYLYGRREGQFLVVSNGGVVESIPADEHAAETVAISVSQCPEAKHVLVIGPGSYGICTAFARLPQVRQVTWFHPDPEYANKLASILPAGMHVASSSVEIPRLPTRQYLDAHRRHFDLILLNLPDATTLTVNRFWSREFYQKAKQALREGGVLGTRVTGAANYLGGELAYLGASALRTIESSFDRVVLKPGDESWMFASDGSTLSSDASVLRNRHAALQAADTGFPSDGLFSLYLPDRASYQLQRYREQMAVTPEHILLNTDQRPRALLFSTMLALRKSEFFSATKHLPTILGCGLGIVVCPILVYGVLRWIYLFAPLHRTARRDRTNNLFDGWFLILTTGVTGMSVSILLMFLYQSRFGALYLHIGLISSLFMLGSAAGSLFMDRLLRQTETTRNTTPHLGQCTGNRCKGGDSRESSTGWFPLLRWPQHASRVGLSRYVTVCLGMHLLFLLMIALLPDQVPRWSFGVFFGGCGWFVGIYFPIVALQHRRAQQDPHRSGAMLEMLDHMGGAFGAVLSGWILIPLLGITATVLVSGLLIAVNLGPWVVRNRVDRPDSGGDWFDAIVRPLGYTLFGIGATVMICSNLYAFASPNQDNQRMLAAAQEMASGRELREQRATVNDEIQVRYLMTESGEMVFSSQSLCEDVVGYGGPLVIAAFVQDEGTLRDIRILHSQETPIYLANLQRTWFQSLFGRNIFEPAPFADVDAVSGSTMTSRAVLRTLEQSGARFSAAVLDRGDLDIPRGGSQRFPDRAFLCLSALTVLAIVVRQYPGRWRRRGVLVASLLVAGMMLNVQYSTQQTLSLLSCQVHGRAQSGSFFLLILVPLIVVLFGNVYCGYGCPMGAMQELLGDIGLARKIPNPDKRMWRYGRMVKYVLLLLVVVLFATTRNFAVLSADPLISLFARAREPAVLALVGIVLVVSLAYRRFWCRNLCPAGAFLALLGGFRLLRRLCPTTRPTKCDLGVLRTTELDCIRCDRCRNEKD